MQVINSLLSQMVNTKEGEKFKIGSNNTANMDVYDFKNFVAEQLKNQPNKTATYKNVKPKKRKCIILVLKKKQKT